METDHTSADAALGPPPESERVLKFCALAASLLRSPHSQDAAGAEFCAHTTLPPYFVPRAPCLPHL